MQHINIINTLISIINFPLKSSNRHIICPIKIPIINFIIMYNSLLILDVLQKICIMVNINKIITFNNIVLLDIIFIVIGSLGIIDSNICPNVKSSKFEYRNILYLLFGIWYVYY